MRDYAQSVLLFAGGDAETPAAPDKESESDVAGKVEVACPRGVQTASGKAPYPSVVLVSPLVRAQGTAAALFGDAVGHGIETCPAEVAQDGRELQERFIVKNMLDFAEFSHFHHSDDPSPVGPPLLRSTGEYEVRRRADAVSLRQRPSRPAAASGVRATRGPLPRPCSPRYDRWKRSGQLSTCRSPSSGWVCNASR